MGSAKWYMMMFVGLLPVATNVASRATLRGIVGSRLQLLESDFLSIMIRWAI